MPELLTDIDGNIVTLLDKYAKQGKMDKYKELVLKWDINIESDFWREIWSLGTKEEIKFWLTYSIRKWRFTDAFEMIDDDLIPLLLKRKDLKEKEILETIFQLIENEEFDFKQKRFQLVRKRFEYNEYE